MLCLLTGSLAACALQAQLAPNGQPKPSAAIPETQPTTLLTAAPAPPLTPSQKPPHRATVRWQGGMLSVDADNSSLNQILRDISRETGMKVTGGVTEERVFGTYGPGGPSKVLDALLDGTGSNMLLLLNDDAGPAELILTPRHGGPTPPSPTALPHDDDDLPPQRVVPVNRFQQHESMPQQAQPTPVAPSASTFVPPPPPPDSPASTNATDTTTQQSPSGVKTPQQIYEQLLKLQQKNATQTTPQ